MSAKKLLLAAAAAAVAAVGLTAALVASAQEDGTGEAQTSPRDVFIERLAENLGIDSATLRQALRDTGLELVDEALAAGRITDAQAERARERIESGKGLPFGAIKERVRARHQRMLQVRRALIASAADALGMTPDELKAELKAGKSVADVAAERGVGLDDVKAQIIADAEEKLDAAVASGRITDERAVEMLEKLTARLDELLQRSREPAP